MAKFELDDSNEVKLEKLEALLARESADASSLAPLYAALLSVQVQGHYQPLEMTAERQKHRTLEALVDHIKDLTRRNPVMCLFEDIHWADPTTLELLGRMIESVQNVPILVVLTYRPEFSPPWRGFTHVTSLTLNRFTRRLASALVESVSDGALLPDEVRQQIIEKTDGVPIFIEELTKNILESTLTSGDSPTVAIPTTLHDSLMARLDRLGAVKEVAQTASVLGREFDRNLLALVSPLGPDQLDSALDQLFGAELIYRRGQPEEGRYIFKHALVQDAAYGSLLKAKRQTLHRNIARALDDRFPERTDAAPEMLAHHYTEAGMPQEAIPLWSDAGTRAASRHAVLEAINHFRRALQLLSETPPDHLRDEREMKLQIALGSVMQSLGAGIPEVAAAYNRAHELSQRIANTPDLFSILHGLWHFSVFRAEIVQSAELVAQMRRLAGAGENTEQQVVTYYASSFLALMSADLETAREEQETGLALFNGLPRDLLPFRAGQNPGVAFQVYAGLALWLQGYPDQAAARCRQGISLAREINHPFSLAFSFDISLVVFHSLREIKVVKELSDEDIELSERHGFGQWLHAARIWKGWVESMTDPSGSGLEQMIEANEMVRSKDGAIFQGNSQGAIAGAYLQAGQFESALSAANEALAHVERTGECWWEAESHRLKGQALRGLGEESSVFEDCFSRALEVARSQQSRSLELRAAVDLAQVWIDRDKRDDARKLLAPVYDWFTEGFNTPDLKEARSLLAQLT